MIRLSVICGFFVCALLQAAVPRAHVEVVTTDHVVVAPGGVIHIDGSYGELNIEGWDEPQVEITVTRFAYPAHDTPALRDAASHELDGIKVTATKSGDRDLTITTPRARRGAGIKLDYRIRVPRSSSLVIHHGTGDILVGDVVGNIDAAIKYGDILLRLPEKESYSFDASCKEGGIESDFAGAHSRAHLFGSKFNQPEVSGAHRIHLHAGIGGIKIQQLLLPTHQS